MAECRFRGVSFDDDVVKGGQLVGTLSYDYVDVCQALSSQSGKLVKCPHENPDENICPELATAIAEWKKEEASRQNN